MDATVEALDDNKVKLSVTVAADEFEVAVDEAFRRIAREVRIPGFRPGKAPRKVLEARIGTGVAREEALREALPEYYAQALQEHDVDAIAAPDIDITEGQETGPVVFDAVVEVRPEVQVAGYDHLRVTIPSPLATDEEVDAQIDRLREPEASLETVERPAVDGDHVLIDIAGSQGDEQLDGLTADDYLYEVGSEVLVSEIDENLRGAKPGDILQFEADHPDPDEDEPLSFRVLVKEVQEKVLPEVTDSWAVEASEFDTVDALRADLTENIGRVKASQAHLKARDEVATALAELVEIEPPPPMVDSEVQNRLQDLALRLAAQGIDTQQWLEATGQSVDQITAELRESAGPAVLVDLGLRAVAVAESLEPSDAELDAELEAMAERFEREPGELRRELEQAGQMSAVRSELTKRLALDWLLDHAEIVDEEGNEVPLESLSPPADEGESDTDQNDEDEDEDREQADEQGDSE